MNDMTPVARGSNTPQPPKPLTTAEIDAYLDYAMESLTERRDALIAVLAATVTSIPRIDDDETLGDVGENMRMASALTRTGDERRKEHKEPFLTGGRTVDSWFRTFNTPLSAAMSNVQAIMDDYGKRKAERARLAARAQAQALQDEADRAAAKAAKALDKGKSADTLLDRAAAAAKAAEAAEALAAGKAADLTRSRGTFGATMSMRTTWGYEITDLAAVPRKYLTVNDGAVKEAMKTRDQTGCPTTVIPGIAWKSSSSMGVK